MQPSKELLTLFMLLGYKENTDNLIMPGYSTDEAVFYIPKSETDGEIRFYPHPYGGDADGKVEFKDEQELIDFLTERGK